jgi:hypothetical protein
MRACGLDPRTVRVPRTVRAGVGFVGLAALVTLIPLAPATAAGPPRGGSAGQATVKSAAASPVGQYEIYSSNGGSGALTLTAGGSFTTDYGDSGMWVSQHTSVAMRVNTVNGDDGCLYLGSFSKTAINSAHAQGPTNCGGTQDTWYAVKLTKKALATAPLSASHVPTASTKKKTEEPAPQYDVALGSEIWDLEVSTDGLSTMQIDGATPPGPGFWVVRGKVFAFTAVLGIIPPYSPCLFLGTFSSTGVGTPTTPGVALCPDDEVPLAPWYATLPA